MRRFLFTIILVLFILLQVVRGQSNQTVTDGSTTTTFTVINTATKLLDTSINTVIGAFSFGDFTSADPGCNSSPVSFSITVNPASTSPVITAGPVTGTISACAGMASAGPNTGHFAFSAKDLGAPVLATAPAGFEISLAPNNGFAKTLTVPATSGAVGNTLVYVRLSATAPPGKPSGNIVLSSAGVVKDVLVTGTVNTLPTINSIADQKYANGNATKLIHFSGTGNTFNWTNDTPGIGLPASGSGDIESFIATNPGSSPVTAHIKVTPVSEAYAYISDYAKGVLYVFNTLTNVLEKTIKIETSPGSVVVSPDGSRVYVSNTNIITNTGGTVSVINTGTNAVITTISVGRYPYGLAVSADGSRLFVANNVDGTVSVINTATNKVISTILVDPSANLINLVVSPDGKTLYTIDQNYNNVGMKVAVVDILSGTVTTIIGLGMPTPPIQAPAAGIVITPDGSRVYVANSILNTISVINTTNNSVISDIPIGETPHGLALSPDGRKLYITNGYNGYVKVLDLVSGTIIAQVFLGDNQNPYDIAVSADGNLIYTENGGSYSVIDASTYAIIAEVPINYAYQSDKFGNFLKSGSGCSGMPVDFTITVTPAAQPPVITAGPVSGTISACAGTASADPEIQQFLVSGSNLTDEITATAPPGFEIALSAPGPYQNTLTLGRTNGTVSPVPVFVRSSATAPTGDITGNVVLVSGGTSQTVAVSAGIHALPSLRPAPGQIKANGSATDAIHFNGTGDTYTWVNDTPGIGMPASGTGDIPSFSAINTGQVPVIATITVTPRSAVGCSGPPVVFTIRVEPDSPSILTAEGSFAGFSTTYGTPSPSSSFTASGTNTPAGILITPPAGYELSADNINFTNTLTLGSAGQVATTTVYIRLAAVTPVGNYTGSIVLSSGNISNASLIIASGVVSPANLIISADDQTKPYGADNPVLTISYTGFQNNDGPAQLIQPPQISTNALTNSPIGRYDILIGGAAAANYAITYRPGVLVILPVGKLLIPNAFTPNGDGINDTWNIQNIDQFPNCTVHIYDRWGTSVYSSIGYGTPWNGNYKGKPLPFSAYYYVIDLKNDKQPLSGYVTIVR